MSVAVLPIPLRPWPQEPQSPVTGPNEQQPGAPVTGTQQDPAAGRPGAAPGCGTETIVMVGVFLLLMWLLVLRPESKRRRESQNMLARLKRGDTVVTIGGMHGVIDSLGETRVTLRVGDVPMVFDRSAIARLVRDEPAGGAGAEKPDKR